MISQGLILHSNLVSFVLLKFSILNCFVEFGNQVPLKYFQKSHKKIAIAGTDHGEGIKIENTNHVATPKVLTKNPTITARNSIGTFNHIAFNFEFCVCIILNFKCLCNNK